MARKIEWGGEWIATLIEDEDDPSNNFIAPPVVFDTNGMVIMGVAVLEEIAESGSSVEHPILRDYTPGDLAALEQKLARVSEVLGVPLGSL
jgi:hypothetical protein